MENVSVKAKEDFERKLKEYGLEMEHVNLDFTQFYKEVKNQKMREYVMDKVIMKECVKALNDRGHIIDYDFDSIYPVPFEDNIKENIFKLYRTLVLNKK